jgi:hypothetical protein
MGACRSASLVEESKKAEEDRKFSSALDLKLKEDYFARQKRTKIWITGALLVSSCLFSDATLSYKGW